MPHHEETQTIEAALQRSEEQLRALVANAPVVLTAIDRDGIYVVSEGKGLARTGLRPGELVGKSIFDVVAEVPGGPGYVRRALAGETVTWHAAMRGAHFDVLMTPRFDLTGEIVGAIAVSIDITDRALAEQAQRRSEARFRAVVENSADCVMLVAPDGTVDYASPALERLLGRPPEEVVGQPLSDLAEPDDRESLRNTFQRALGTARSPLTVELRAAHRDGSVRTLELTLSNQLDDPAVEALVVNSRDMTEQRKASVQLRAAEERLLQSQKMEAVGNLAGGVAHDFNNLLSLILTFGSLALDALPAGSPAHADVNQVVSAAQKAAELTRQLLAFSSLEVVELQVLDLGERVASLHEMLARLLGENVRLRINAAPEPTLVYAGPVQIDQVVMNLALNARDAMPGGGLLVIETDNAQLDQDYVLAHPDATPGDYVRLTVTDAGTGMTPATLDRIFEPFFTTKPKGKGSGLGLSTVFGIVKQLNGHISVTTEVDAGTTFRIYIPRSTRPLVPASLPAAAPSSLGGTETLLVVEDDDRLRAALRTVLSKQGYRVLEAQNGSEALMISDQFQLPIHLLLTDVVMPRMSGRELVPQLLAQREQLRVLYISGYSENGGGDDGEPGFDYLSKPVTPKLLLRKVREVLDAPKPSLP